MKNLFLDNHSLIIYYQMNSYDNNLLFNTVVSDVLLTAPKDDTRALLVHYDYNAEDPSKACKVWLDNTTSIDKYFEWLTEFQPDYGYDRFNDLLGQFPRTPGDIVVLISIELVNEGQQLSLYRFDRSHTKKRINLGECPLITRSNPWFSNEYLEAVFVSLQKTKPELVNSFIGKCGMIRYDGHTIVNQHLTKSDLEYFTEYFAKAVLISIDMQQKIMREIKSKHKGLIVFAYINYLRHYWIIFEYIKGEWVSTN